MHGCVMRLKSVQSEDVDASEQPSHSPGAAHAPHGRRSPAITRAGGYETGRGSRGCPSVGGSSGPHWHVGCQQAEELIQPHTPCPVLIGVRGWKPATEQATTDIASRPGTESPSGQRTPSNRTKVRGPPRFDLRGRLTASPHRMGRSIRLETDAGTMVAAGRNLGRCEGWPCDRDPRLSHRSLGLQDERGWIHLERLRLRRSHATRQASPAEMPVRTSVRIIGTHPTSRCRTCGTKVPPFWVDGRTPPSDTWVEPRSGHDATSLHGISR